MCRDRDRCGSRRDKEVRQQRAGFVVLEGGEGRRNLEVDESLEKVWLLAQP